MKFVSKIVLKIVGVIVGIGCLIGFLIWAGAFTENDAIHVTSNGARAAGVGTSVAAGGFLTYLQGIGEGFSVWKADQGGTDKVPQHRVGKDPVQKAKDKTASQG